MQVKNNTNNTVGNIKTEYSKNTAKVSQQEDIKVQNIEKNTVSISQEAIEKQKNAAALKIEGNHIQTEKTFDAERLKKLEALKSQIKNGEFKVDANALASKMLNDPQAINNLLN